MTKQCGGNNIRLHAVNGGEEALDRKGAGGVKTLRKVGGHRRGLEELRDPLIGNDLLDRKGLKPGLTQTQVVKPSITCRVLAVLVPAVRQILDDRCHGISGCAYGYQDKVWGLGSQQSEQIE